MTIQTGKQLKDFTTFGIGGKADFFVSVKNIKELRNIALQAKTNKQKIFVLGGGSNILISDTGYKGLVVHLSNMGIEEINKTKQSITLKIQGGEIWDNVVSYAVKHNYWGIENLSHIPGQAGAGAVQNIGAYGQELKDTLQHVRVFDLRDLKIKQISADKCKFGYRSSIFNTIEKGRYVILEIVIRLSLIPRPLLNYKDLQKYFSTLKSKPSIREIRKAVINIRDDKFPFPTGPKNGSAGSFFKNSTLTKSQYNGLLMAVEKKFSAKDLLRLKEISRADKKGYVKVPTAFLIDILGFKGLRVGGAKINEKQPLVILNTGKARARDVIKLAKQVTSAIHKNFGLKIKIEPELIGFNRQPL